MTRIGAIVHRWFCNPFWQTGRYDYQIGAERPKIWRCSVCGNILTYPD